MSVKPVYLPLAMAARQAHMSVKRLRWLCQSDSIEFLGGPVGDDYWVDSSSIDRRVKRLAL